MFLSSGTLFTNFFLGEILSLLSFSMIQFYCFNLIMMFRDNLKSKESAIDETEVVQVLHRVKMILNNKKYINEVKNMLPHNQNANQ